MKAVCIYFMRHYNSSYLPSNHSLLSVKCPKELSSKSIQIPLNLDAFASSLLFSISFSTFSQNFAFYTDSSGQSCCNRCAGSSAMGRKSDLPDAHTTSGCAPVAIYWSVENGMMSGKATGTLDSSGPVTCIQAAAMMQRYYLSRYGSCIFLWNRLQTLILSFSFYRQASLVSFCNVQKLGSDPTRRLFHRKRAQKIRKYIIDICHERYPPEHSPVFLDALFLFYNGFMKRHGHQGLDVMGYRDTVYLRHRQGGQQR